ncbi:MAG: DUF2256 domain-containing protein [Acinetobacter sp.]
MRSSSLVGLMSYKMKKHHLPKKICINCLRPFNWRKKWQRCWEEVKYCSERCRRESKQRPK